MAVDLTENFATGAYRDAYVGPAARELAAEVDVECAARAVTDDILAEVWPDTDDTSFYEALHRSVLSNLQAIFDILAGRGPSDTTPAGALEFAEVTARLDIPVAEIDKAYRVGLASLWGRWFEVAQARADLDGSRIDELISGPTLTIHAYIDRVLDAVVARHEEIRCELQRTQNDLRRLTLTHILDGTIDEITDELGRTLDYCLADTHLALLLSTADTRPPKREIAALRDAADARGTLVLQHGPRSWIAWLGRPGGFEPAHLSRLRRALTQTPFIVAVGEPAAGLHGLRRTRQQALEAARVQRALGADGTPCVWAHEVRLEALLLNDEDRAREFLADELGRLGAPEACVARLRETLLAWLATGSHVSAAAMLHVHENTVRNRIRAAEALLGTPLMGRRTELQVALRLERVLNAPQAEQLAGAA